MNLHTCTIQFSDDRILTYQTVEQSLDAIEQSDSSSISEITIDATDGRSIRTYQSKSLEESIESLMNL
ncbi:hypothetical protein ACQEXU_19425 [Vibrio sp. TRT 21S02]|uniref:hypothetical protein n=1 Tax=Vibrio sp. TRT 21S02 TaxID=3418507 RepID=UPI003CF1FABB